MEISIVLVGVGGVGKCLVNQIIDARDVHAKRYNVKFTIKALVDSAGVVSNASGLSDTDLKEAIKWKSDGQSFSKHAQGKAMPLAEVVKTFCDKQTILIDCSATDATVQPIISALNAGAGVALANKKPLTVSLDSWKQMSSAGNYARLKYESSVGAGTPMVACLTRLINSGDEITKIQGTFSGTLGFLMTGLEQGRPYSEVVNEAAKLGYTEPDPRDDLGGVDVARKALILARSMGWELSMEDIQIDPLYDAPTMGSLSIPDFVKALPQLDAQYKAKHEAAAKENKVLRYIATIENKKCTVSLVALAKDTPIGRLVGSDNMVAFNTKIYGEKPMVVQGAGAGGPVTAAGVLADMIELAGVLSSKL